MNTNVNLNPPSTGGVGGKKNPNKNAEVSPTTKKGDHVGVGGVSNPNPDSVFNCSPGHTPFKGKSGY